MGKKKTLSSLDKIREDYQAAMEGAGLLGGSARPEHGPTRGLPRPQAGIWSAGGTGSAMPSDYHQFLLQPWLDLAHLHPDPYLWGNHPECGSLASVYWRGMGRGVGVLDLK